MVDYVYGDVTEHASEMNVSLEVMLWDGINWRCRVPSVIFQTNGVGHGRRVTARRYVDGVIQPVPVPFTAGRRGMGFVLFCFVVFFKFIFVSPARQTQSPQHAFDFLYRTNIVTMDWPDLSPDLTPIGQLWN